MNFFFKKISWNFFRRSFFFETNILVYKIRKSLLLVIKLKHCYIFLIHTRTNNCLVRIKMLIKFTNELDRWRKHENRSLAMWSLKSSSLEVTRWKLGGEREDTTNSFFFCLFSFSKKNFFFGQSRENLVRICIKSNYCIGLVLDRKSEKAWHVA